MFVSCTPHFSQDLWDKNVYVARYLSGMLYHFQDLHLGEGITEIVYHAVAGDSVYLVSFGECMTYSRKTKNVGSVFKIDYETVHLLEGEALLQYVSQQIIAESQRIAEKRIKLFDLELYINHLERYFAEALELMRSGKNPDEGKEYNETIQSIIAKKWSRL